MSFSDSIARELPARYRDPRPLADGGEGGTWIANEGDSGRTVVLKPVSRERRRALRRAFQVLRRVSSPHLPAVLELLEDRVGRNWLVTAWIDGSPLSAGPVVGAQALAEARGVAHALSELHAYGTHHGDVSASNVILTPTRGVVLTDLGQVGALGAGTPGFLAPEVLAGGGGPAADRFALGCLLCLRLFGHVPWREPASLVRVRDGRDVRARLATLADAAEVRLTGPVERLLVRLLHPDPERRVQDGRALVRRLGDLGDLGGGSDIGGAAPVSHWWVPARWVYRGTELDAVVGRLRGDGGPRVVAVAGPKGSGRGRVVEELVHVLQEFARPEGETDGGSQGAASLSDVGELARGLGGGDDAAWIAAWLDSDAQTVGVRDELLWPDGFGSAALKAALLRHGASLSRATLVVPVDEALASALPGDDPRIAVIAVRRWSAQDVHGALDDVLEAGDEQAWTSALLGASDGWPARIVRTIEACAAQGIVRPEPSLLRRALEGAGVGERLERARARETLEAHWRLVEDGSAQPGAWLVAAARNTLSEEIAPLAEASAQACLSEGRSISLELAVDLDDVSHVLAALERIGKDDADLPRSIDSWLDAHAERVVEARHRCVIARQQLRWAAPAKALEWLDDFEDAESRYLRGRALLHLGRSVEALVSFESPASARECGLRWRALVDCGRAQEAWAEASEWMRSWDAHAMAPGAAVAALWGGLAAMHVGAADSTLCFDRAVTVLPLDADRETLGVQARALQLRANQAEAAGAGLIALDGYRQAAAAFADAGEGVGRVLVDGSVSALAHQAGEVGESLERGRRALRGLVALGHLDLLPAVLFNVVQPLVLVDATEEATAYLELVAGLCEASDDLPPLSHARLARVAAEIAAASAERDPVPDRVSVERVMAESAAGLEAHGAPREACDAWLHAACWARRAGSTTAAREHLDAATRCLGDHPQEHDIETRLGVALEALAQAPDGPSLASATRELAKLPGPPALAASGKLMLAWIYDRTLLAALLRQYRSDHTICRTVARRQVQTLESIMSKVHNLDRDASRTALLKEAGDPEPLRALVRTLEEDAHALDAGNSTNDPGPSRPVPANRELREAGDADRLLLLFRRLGREDEIERLLEQLVEAMMELTRAERGVVEVGSGVARIEVAREFSNAGDGVRYSRSIIESVRKHGEPIISVDAAADDRFDQSRSISHLNLRSVLAVPLIFRGEVLGAAYVDHRLRRGAFDEKALALMEDFCGLAALAVAHTQAMSELRSQATQLETQQVELAKLLETRDVEVQGLREAVRSQVPERRSYRGMIGGSAAMQRIFKLIDRLAESDVPVVIHGESGTGKELVARAIHDAGPRSARPFVAENCGAIPETLLESVLFGHARGAFTGANVAKPGLFEAANGGTIFLDEVGEMSAAMQTKLLRVLQEGEIRRVGENQSRKIDVRVIAASNRDLETMVEEGSFRSDLYYRINVVRVDLPPLRDRREDIAPLVLHFLERHGGTALDVSAAAMRKLTRYPWPGNVRELENETLRWVALADDQVKPEDLATPIQALDGEVDDPDDLSLRPRVDRLERELIARALQRTGGNQTQAASLLGLSRYGLQKKLRRLTDATAAST